MNSSAGGIQITPLDPAAFRHMPWKNGGGVTIDIAVTMLPGFEPGSWEGIIWRFSRTAIVTPGAFSDLSGFDRELALISGQGLVLRTPVGEIDVRQPFRPVRFAGETSIVSRLEAGRSKSSI
jgi:environmental stress-induced protein Ves